MQQPPTEVDHHKFCTGSSYIGKLDEDGKMTGYGTYRYPNGIEYEGYFKSGVFHGRGMLINPSKFKIYGNFVDGKCNDCEIFFNDGLEFKEVDWKYCTAEDRRFWIEIVQGLSPVGETFLTNEKPARAVPPGHYDTGEGFFDPETEYVVDAETGERIRYVCAKEREFIQRYYRMNASDFLKKAELADENTDSHISTDSYVSLSCDEDGD